MWPRMLLLLFSRERSLTYLKSDAFSTDLYEFLLFLSRRALFDSVSGSYTSLEANSYFALSLGAYLALYSF